MFPELNRRWRGTVERFPAAGFALGVGFCLILAACGTSEPTPTPTPVPTPTPSGEMSEPAMMMGIDELVNGPTDIDRFDDPELQKRWNDLIAAAQAEGQLVVVGGSAAVEMRPWAKFFSDKYGIEVRTSGGTSSAIVARVLAERAAGRYTVDLFLSGLETVTTQLVPAGAMQPIEPVLFHPNVTDLTKWYPGERIYADGDGLYTFLFASNRPGPGLRPGWYNTNNLSQEEVLSVRNMWEFLEVDWDIVSTPVTGSGSGGAWNSAWYHPDLGPEWIEAYFRNPNVTWLNDARLILDGLVRGAYDVEFASQSLPGEAERLVESGAPIASASDLVEDTWEGVGVIGGGGSGNMVSATQNPAHPAVQQLYLNWFLTQEGQTQRHLLGTVRNPSQSLRLDVTEMGEVDPTDIRDPNVEYSFLYQQQEFNAEQAFEDMRALFRGIHG